MSNHKTSTRTTGATDAQIERAVLKWPKYDSTKHDMYRDIVEGYAIDLVPPESRVIGASEIDAIAALYDAYLTRGRLPLAKLNRVRDLIGSE
jgi:hypothetical protein